MVRGFDVDGRCLSANGSATIAIAIGSIAHSKLESGRLEKMKSGVANLLEGYFIFRSEGTRFSWTKTKGFDRHRWRTNEWIGRPI